MKWFAGTGGVFCGSLHITALLLVVGGICVGPGCRRGSAPPADPVERLALARNCARNGDIEKALELYKSLVESGVGNRSRIALEAALVCRKANTPEGVLYFTDFVDEKAPERRTADELVVEALLNKKDRAALEHFLRRKWKDPVSRAWAAPFLAELLMSTGAKDEALDIYGALIREQPEREEEWRLARARLLLRAGDTARARAEFDAILRRNPKSTAGMLGLAALAAADREWDEAEQLFRKTLEVDPDNPDAKLGLAFVAVVQRRFPEALKIYESLLNAPDPPYLKLLPYLDLLYELRRTTRLQELAAAKGNAKSSAPAARQSANGSSPGKRVFHLYAAALVDLRAGKRDAALATLEKILKLVPDPPDVHLFVRYARLLLEQGRIADARDALERARRIGPLSDSGILLLADIALREGRIPTAMRLARTVGRDNPRAAVLLARCEAAMGRVEEAGRVLERRRKLPAARPSKVADAAAALLEADQFEKSGDFRKAEALLEKAAAGPAGNPAVLLARAKRFWAAGERAKAAAVLDELVKRLPEGEAKLAALRLRLRVALVLGDAATARALLDRLEAMRAPGLDLYRGWLAAVQGKWTEAVALLKKSEVRYGWDGVVRFLLLGLSAMRSGDASSAAMAFDNALAALAEPPVTLYELARDVNILAGNLDIAVTRAEACVRLRPDDPTAVLLLSRLYADTHRSRQRVKLMEEAVRRFPDRADVYLEFCHALVDAGDIARAETAARDAVKRFPDEHEFRVCLARILLIQRRSDELRQLVRTVPANSAQGVTARVILALDRIYARDAAGARAIVQTLPADDPRVQLLSAWIDLLEGKKDEARGKLETLTAQHADLFQAWLLLGSVYSAEGLYDRAADALRRCLDLEPNSVVALNNLAWVLVRSGRSLAEASGCARKARSLAPESSEVNDTFAAVALLTGQWQEALEAALKAAAANPQKFWPWLHAAQAALRLGRPREAAAYLRKAAAAARTPEHRQVLADVRRKIAAPAPAAP